MLLTFKFPPMLCFTNCLINPDVLLKSLTAVINMKLLIVQSMQGHVYKNTFY